MSRESKIIKKVRNQIMRNEIDYEGICNLEDFWDIGVHVAMDKATMGPPFYRSFDEYSKHWFKYTKEDFVSWLKHLIEVSK